ncbi:type IV conjugative transfer system coupling protein TraD [Vibrio sp.]|nr:type IV conjugative transfer system coupling protein TraD [Vibrio sp.]
MASKFTRGGQITFHSIRMWLQVNGQLINYTFFLFVLFTSIITAIMTPLNEIIGTFYYLRNKISASIGTPLDKSITTYWDGNKFESTLGEQLYNPLLFKMYEDFSFNIQVYSLSSLIICSILFTFVSRYFARQGEDHSDDLHIRGLQFTDDTNVITESLQHKAKHRLKHQRLGNGKISTFNIDGHRIFKNDFEVQHLLIDGTTGAGKSVCIRKILKWVKSRGDKAIVYDKGCTFLSKFYNPKEDFILNPFDERCVNWDIWADAKDISDFDFMAQAIIPSSTSGDPFWINAARTLFSSTAYQMTKDGKPLTNERFLHLMLTADLNTLNEHLDGTEGASLTANEIQKTAITIKSVLATYVKSLRYLDGLNTLNDDGTQQRATFSITDWVQDDSKRGFVYLTSNAQQHTSLRPLITTWLSIASNAILGLEANEDRRIWVIMDEMPSLHQIPELGSIISEVRKFGGCFLIGIQSYAQLVKTYGQHAADEIFDLLNTRFYYRAPSAQMAKISSNDLGEQEVDISKENISYGANTLRDGVSLGHQTITRPVVTTGEIQALNDLQCFVRVPDCEYITKLDLKFDKIKDTTPSFIKRNMVMSQEMTEVWSSLIHAEIIAPNNLLDADDKNKLRKMQSSNFESESDMREYSSEIVDSLNRTSPLSTQNKTNSNDLHRVNEEHSINDINHIDDTLEMD